MNFYPIGTVIERNGLVGIITNWFGNSICEVMLEDGKHDVVFRNWQLGTIVNFKVIG